MIQNTATSEYCYEVELQRHFKKMNADRWRLMTISKTRSGSNEPRIVMFWEREVL